MNKTKSKNSQKPFVKHRISKDRELFNRIANKYTHKDLAPICMMARKRRLLATIDALGKKFPHRPRILEVGCAGGFSTRYLHNKFCEYVGVDHAELLIDYARAWNSREGVSFLSSDILNYHTDIPFDIILLIGVLHHFSDLQANLSHIKSLLKPGGWILANEPQCSNKIINVMRMIRKGIDISYSTEQIYFSPNGLRKAYSRAGFRNVAIRAQGIFSTPFAEVILSPTWLFYPLAVTAIHVDTFLERRLGQMFLPITWNIVALGQAPNPVSTCQD